MTLASHVAAQRNQHGGAKGKFIGAQQRGDEHITAGAQPTVAAQAHTAPQAVLHQHLLRFRKPNLPRVAGVLDAGQG